jgi:SM-20-related protein
VTDTEIEQLGRDGYFQREDFPDATEAAAQLSRLFRLRQPPQPLSPATISHVHRFDTSVRNDSLRWIGPQDPVLSGLFAHFGALRLELNEGAWLGLSRFELQLAQFKRGGHYSRHFDALHGPENRRVTAIVYLNSGWIPAHRGQLRIWGEAPRLIEPLLGRLVVFLSERVEHEVLSSRANRMAITAWYYGG